MKRLLPALIIGFFSFTGYTQCYNRLKLDSLGSTLQHQEGIPRINTLIKLSESYYYFNLDTALFYAVMAQTESRQYSYQWGFHKTLYCKSLVFSENQPIKKIEPLLQYTSNWFYKNDYEEDALHCEILHTTFVHKLNGRLASKLSAEQTLDRAIELNNTQLLGRAWFNVLKFRGPQLAEKKYPYSLDSAQHYIQLAKDSAYLVKLGLHGMMSKNGSLESIAFSKKMVSQTEAWNNNNLRCLSYSHLGLNYAGRRKLDSAEYCYQRKMEIAREYGSLSLEQKTLQSLAYTYMLSDSLEIALEKAYASKKIAKELNHYIGEAWLMNIICNIYALQGDYEQGINATLTFLELANTQKDEYQIYSAKRLLGEMYVETDQYDKAETIYNEAIEWIKTADENPLTRRSRGNLYMHIGNLNLKKGNYNTAIENFERAYEDFIERSRYSIVPRISILKTYLDQENLDKATEAYHYVMDSYSELIRSQDVGLDLQFGRYYVATERFSAGIKSLEKYLKRTQTGDYEEDRKVAYLNLYRAYSATGQFEAALSAHVSFNTIDDSLKAGVQKENVRKIQSDYEISLKEATIADLEQRRELQDLKLAQQNQTLKLRSLYIIMLVFIVLIIAGGGYWIFKRFKSKKEHEEIQLRAEQAELKLENLETRQKAEIAEVKNTLFANVSHEFRTPLTLIQVPLKNHLTRISDTEKPLFDGILNQTDQLLKMVDEMLDLARMESGTMEITRLNFSLSPFFSTIQTYFTPLFAEKEIDFVWHNKLENFQLNADENRLRIVMNNLLKNAYNHTPEKGYIECKIGPVPASRAFSSGIQITVSNSGGGISPENLPYIFDRHFRGHDKDYTGSGIGLSLTKEIIELHDGTISAKSAEDKTVSFTINLPGALFEIDDTLKEPGETHSKQLETEISEAIEKPHLLVVEDNSEMQKLLLAVLSPEFTVRMAENGAIGEKLALEHQPDIVLSDVMMPQKDGFELLQALKHNLNSSHIPVVLLTAKADISSRISGLNQDADDYISKPFDPKELIARLKNLLRQRKKLQKLFSENPLLHVKNVSYSEIDAKFFEKARKILEENYQDGTFSVGQFCKELALNRNSVHNKIMAFTNDNTSRYIKNFRLEKSAKMLLETTTSIGDVYLKNGFNSSQAFNKAFKERFKSTPSEFRETNKR